MYAVDFGPTERLGGGGLHVLSHRAYSVLRARQDHVGIGVILYDGCVPTRAPEKTKLTILRGRQLVQHPWLVHGFSTRVGGFSRAYRKGDLNLGFTKDDSRVAVERNRSAFLRQLGALSLRN